MAITLEQALAAVPGTRANYSKIAQNLNCSRHNIEKLRDKWGTLKIAMDQERKKYNDELTESIQNRALGESDAMAKLYANTQMGWKEQTETKLIGKVEIVVIYDTDNSKT